jgi:hypothetical protein
MNIPIRVIGIATVFLWLFLIVFSVSAAYSIKDFQFNFGNPQLTYSGGNQLQIAVPLSVSNGGKFEMSKFNLTSILNDNTNRTITRGSTFVDAISPGGTVNTAHAVVINITSLLQSDQSLLFNDSQMTLNEHFRMTLADLLPVGAAANIPIPWGAPLHDLEIGLPQHNSFNGTYINVAVPISFDNHAQFCLQGTFQTAIYTNTGTLVTQSQTSFNVTQNSSYQGYANMYLPISPFSQSCHFEISILTPFINYGPIVMPYE